MGLYMIVLWREIFKPVLNLNFTALDKMESISEFGPRTLLA
jgi:hypothetical protein